MEKEICSLCGSTICPECLLHKENPDCTSHSVRHRGICRCRENAADAVESPGEDGPRRRGRRE